MAGTDVTLTSPKIKVIFPNGREPLVVQTILSDLVQWDITAHKHKWPKYDEAPWLWLSFLSWSAARRLGEDNGQTYEQWRASVLECVPVDTETVDPTQAGAEPE